MLRYVGKLLPFCVASLPLLATSNTFITMGPAPSLNTQEGGHNSDAGSVNPIAVHPTDPNTYFITSVNGGIWRTKDGGTSWIPLTDHQNTLSIGSIAYDLDDPSHTTLVAGTGISSNGGIGYLNLGATYSRGNAPRGLLYTQNSGDTWNTLSSPTLNLMSIPNVISRGLNPHISGSLFVGTFESTQPDILTAPNSSIYGLYKSTDGGATFNLEATGGPNQLGPGPVTSLATKLSDPNTIYAAVTNAGSPSANASAALYKNIDGTGSTWTPVFDQTTVPIGGANPINTIDQWVIKTVTGPNDALAVALVKVPTTLDPNIQDAVDSVFLSHDGGASWTALPMPTVSVNPTGQGVINSDIEIDPLNTNRVYLVGTYDPSAPVNALSAYILQPATSAESFALPSDGTVCHPDARCLVFDAAGRLIVGSDGGLDVRTDPSSPSGSWSSINGNLSLWQPYATAFDANNHIIISAGQDTGTAVQQAPYQTNVYQTFPNTGDGINATVNDEGDTSYFYNSTFNLLSLARATTDSLDYLTLTINGNPFDHNTDAWFSSQLVLNKMDPTKIAFGGQSSVFLGQDDLVNTTIDVTPIGPVSPAIVQAGPMAYGTQDSPNALLVAAQGTNPITGNTLFFTSDASTTNLAALPAYAVQGGNPPSSVVFDGRTQNHFYVADTFTLFGTTDMGNNFTNFASHLMPLEIRFPSGVEFLSNNGVNALFVGGINNVGTNSPLAVADADDAGNLSGWRLFGQSTGSDSTLPNTFAANIQYNNKSDTLLVGLFGRGNWLMFDVTSNFPSAQALWFGKADNDSEPSLSVLNNGNYANRSLEKFGKGTLTITGPATYTGLTTVLGGTLSLINSTSLIPGDVDVKKGRLKGIGQVGGRVTIDSGSTISPGNSIGTLTVGSLVLNSGSFTNIEVNRTVSSQIHVLGSADLDGQVVVDQVPGNYFTQTWDILAADGGISGSFDPTVGGGLPGFSFSLRYFPDLVQLVYIRKIITSGLTGNNLTYANYLNTDAPLSEAAKRLSVLSGDVLEDALEVSAPTRNAISRFVIDNTMFAYSDMLDSHLALAHLNHNSCGQPACGCSDFWMDGFADFAHQEGQDQTPGFTFESEGIFVGYDKYIAKDTLVGITTGYSHSHYHEDSHFGKGDVNAYILSPYGIIYYCDAFIEGALTWSYNWIKNKRHIEFQNYDATASSTHHSNQLMPHLAFGYDWNSCYGVFEPFAELDWVINWDQGFKEHGSDDFDFHQKSSTSSILRSKVGLSVYETWDCRDQYGCGTTYTLKGTAAYVKKSWFGVGKVKTALVHNSKYFTLETFKQDQNLFTFGLTGLFNGTGGWYGSISYDGEFGSNYVSNDVQLQIGKYF